MPSGQSNQASQVASDWIDKVWYVEQVNGNPFGVSAPDPVTFANLGTGTTVQILSSVAQNLTPQTASNQNAPWPWGTLLPSSVATAMSATSSTVEVTGQTTWGQPFHIEYPYNGDPRKLACYIDKSASQIPWDAVVLGTIAGALLGGAAGLAAGPLLLGTVAGLLGGAAGSLIAARGLAQGGGSHTPPAGGGSTPTWVANDGPGQRPGPHIVDGTTA